MKPNKEIYEEVMIKIGLTGNIGSGKSIVTSNLKKRGYIVIDADEIVSKIYLNDEFIKRMILNFGEEILIKNESKLLIDKKAISKIVFNNRLKLIELNKIIEPYIYETIRLEKEYYSQSQKILFFDIPLLFEKKMEEEFDYIILICCDEKTRLKRAADRDGKTTDEIKKIDSNQMCQDSKIYKSDFIIDNNTSIENLNIQINEIIKKIESIC